MRLWISPAARFGPPFGVALCRFETVSALVMAARSKAWGGTLEIKTPPKGIGVRGIPPFRQAQGGLLPQDRFGDASRRTKRGKDGQPHSWLCTCGPAPSQHPHWGAARDPSRLRRDSLRFVPTPLRTTERPSVQVSSSCPPGHLRRWPFGGSAACPFRSFRASCFGGTIGFRTGAVPDYANSFRYYHGAQRLQQENGSSRCARRP